MINRNILEYSKLESLNVSRETFFDLEKFRTLILEKNKELNLISKGSELNSRERHIIDSAQVIDFIDKNDKICTDIGSGSGLPGLVLAIIMKHKNSSMKFQLYEKSYRKSIFLKDISKKLELNTEVLQKDIFIQKNIETDIIIARAFKPLPIILELVNSNFKKFKNIILFLGINGKNFLRQVLREWKFEYNEKKSLTSKDSILLNITSLEKR